MKNRWKGIVRYATVLSVVWISVFAVKKRRLEQRRCGAHRLVFYVVGLEWKMAKKRSTVVIRLVSQAGTGFFYTLRKAVRANAEKLQLMKHDPRVNAHVLFKEEKIKKK